MEPVRTLRNLSVGLPKLIFFALIIFAGWYVYRRFVKDATRLVDFMAAVRAADETEGQS